MSIAQNLKHFPASHTESTETSKTIMVFCLENMKDFLFVPILGAGFCVGHGQSAALAGGGPVRL